MKTFIVTLIATTALTSLSLAQVGYWPDAGLTPRSPTIYVNTNYNNNSLENGDITISANGNVLLAWENDGSGLTDWEATWTLYDSNGNLLTPAITITNIPSANCDPNADSVTNCTYRSCYRSDGSPTPAYIGDYGGKAKGNLFGNGFGFCNGGDNGPACEIPELLAINLGQGGTVVEGSPVAQLLNNDGSRNAAAGGADVAGIRTFAQADTDPAGSIRPADIDFLSNGNFLLVGESRQGADTNLTGQASGNVVVYKVFNPTGGVVKAYSPGSSEPIGQSMWHGAAATANGFALRFSTSGDRIRFFDNNGNPLTTNIDIAAVTGHPEAGQGGRGDGSGFKSNGKDAIVYAVSSSSGPWITVFNADGTVRYSRAATETNDLGAYANSDRLDAAITPDGRVIVAFDAGNNDTNNPAAYKLTQARIFDPCGNPMGPVFYVSESENATNAVASQSAGRPRVAWRGNLIAVDWGSDNDPDFPLTKVLALREFNAPAPLGPTVVLVGANVVISWTGCGVLQQSSDLVTWADISPTAVSPYSVPPPLAAKKFYQLRY
jgi:hypothetical protein